MSDKQVTVGRDERRRIARKLRAAAVYLPNDIESDDLEIAIATTVCDYDVPNVETLLNRLADLIDATCEAHRDVILYPATDLTPEYEEIVYRCDECGEIVSFDEDYDPKTDLPAYCLRYGSRITGIGEPWDE